MGVSKKNGETLTTIDEDVQLDVVCDFSEVSRRWGMEWAQVHADLQAFGEMLNAEDQQAAIEEAGLSLSNVVQKSMDLTRKRNALAAQVVVDIPREWLTKDAPEEIDWSDPENLLDYIKGDYDEALMNQVTTARALSAKNLRGTTSTA